jgi:hypothetical protein
MQVDAVAVLVGKDLDLDVAGLGDEFFDEDAVVAEAGGGLVLRGLEAFATSPSFQAMRMPLPPPPALALIITG